MSGYISKERAEICVMSAIEGSEGDDVLRSLDDVRLAISSEPAAHVAPVVHGRWSKEMRFTEDFMGNRTYGYKCSVCDKLANRLQFCGNCGAKMDESEDKNGETI